MSNNMDVLVVEFAKKFPKCVDHYENGIPILNEFGSLGFALALLESFRCVFAILAKKED